MSSGDVIVIERALLNSPAFRSLRGAAILVLLDFLQRRRGKSMRDRGKKKWLILNQGEIEYCYSTAEKAGITRPRFARAITELTEKGFLDIAHSGNGYAKDKSLYSISERWRDYGTEAFISKTRSKDTRRSRKFSSGSMANIKARGKHQKKGVSLFDAAEAGS